MARNTADGCMFCGEIHSGNCADLKKKPQPRRAASTKTPRPAQPAPSIPSPVEFDELAKAPVRDFSKVQRVRDPATEELSRAITVLADADLLHHTELVKHAELIKLPSSRIQIMIWKQVIRESRSGQ